MTARAAGLSKIPKPRPWTPPTNDTRMRHCCDEQWRGDTERCWTCGGPGEVGFLPNSWTADRSTQRPETEQSE